MCSNVTKTECSPFINKPSRTTGVFLAVCISSPQYSTYPDVHCRWKTSLQCGFNKGAVWSLLINIKTKCVNKHFLLRTMFTKHISFKSQLNIPAMIARLLSYGLCWRIARFRNPFIIFYHPTSQICLRGLYSPCSTLRSPSLDPCPAEEEEEEEPLDATMLIKRCVLYLRKS